METEEEIREDSAHGAQQAPEDGSGRPAPRPREREPRLPLPGCLQEIVGSLLFASETPLSAADLRECVRGVSPEEGDDADVMDVYRTCTNREIEEALRGLQKALEVARCGFALVCAGGQYRLQTVPSCGRYVRALLKLDRPSRLSRASLETLAIVAYRQPITKAEVEQIRGVGVDTIMKTLSDLGLVRLVGRSELPGHPFLYGTTPFFLEHFGLASLDQLNEIDPTLPRSDPKERARLFKKEEKAADPEENAAVAEEKPAEEKPSEDKPVEEDAPEGNETEAAGGQDGVDIISVMDEESEDEVEDSGDDELDEDDDDELDEDDDDELDDEDDEDDDELDDEDDDDEDDDDEEEDEDEEEK